MKLFKHVLTIGGLTFVISVLLNISSTAALALSPLHISFLLLFLIVLIGIIFDIIAVAAAAGQEAPFHAMATDRVPGAKQCVWLVRNADRVSTFCGDIVGDIAGTISGATAAAIIYQLIITNPQLNEGILNTVLLGLVAALTVGGKAAGKSFAINRSTDILYVVGRMIYAFEKMRPNQKKKSKQNKRINKKSK
ncbi:MAG: hypothetical protein GX208_06145 [Firmicutes bacterium]|nr:hypothetical protein [Bacillota bacterium]